MRRLLDIPTLSVKRDVGGSDTYFLSGCQIVGMTNAQNVGNRVRALRDLQPAKFTQYDLAATVGVARSTIASIERGHDSGGVRTMIAIADHFKVPLDWLLCRTVPTGGPLVGKFVDDPDELAWLAFWRDVPEADRDALFRALRIPRSDDRAA